MKLLFIKTLRYLILSIFTVLLAFNVFIYPRQVFADASDCDYANQCVDNFRCKCPDPSGYACRQGYAALVLDENQPCGSSIIGGVEAPDAVANINSLSGGNIGIIFFISRAINFANIVAGILVMINFVVAGFLYLTGAGSASNMSKINERMMWSVVGILMIIGSYTLAAIFGTVFYGDPTFIINPTITGALELSNTVQ